MMFVITMIAMFICNTFKYRLYFSVVKFKSIFWFMFHERKSI